jgi:hypothetical protein
MQTAILAVESVVCGYLGERATAIAANVHVAQDFKNRRLND